MKHNGTSYSWIVKSVIALMAISSIGCGTGYKGSGNAGQNSAAAVDPKQAQNAVDSAQAASDSAQKAMTDANKAMADIVDANGNLNFSIFFPKAGSNNVHTQGILAPL